MADTTLAKKILEAAAPGRARLLVALGMRLGMPVERILSLTVAEIRAAVGRKATIEAQMEGLGDEAMPFASRKGGGTKPVSRIQGWRIVSAVIRRVTGRVGGFGFLRSLLPSGGPSTPVSRPVPETSKRADTVDVSLALHSMLYGTPPPRTG